MKMVLAYGPTQNLNALSRTVTGGSLWFFFVSGRWKAVDILWSVDVVMLF